MKLKLINILTIFLVIASFVLAIGLYAHFPDKVASHWDAAGQVNGFMSKAWGLFLMPVVGLVMVLLLYFLPKLDPLKQNYEKFQKEFDYFIFGIMLFLFYIYLLTIFWNLGSVFNMSKAIVPAIGMLFIIIAPLLRKAKRNYFVGIRTPWTLANDEVWNKTHKLAAILFYVLGLITLLGFFYDKYVFYVFLVGILLVVIILFVYSYLLYRGIKK